MGNSNHKQTWVIGDPAEEMKLHSGQWNVHHYQVMTLIRAIPHEVSPSAIASTIFGLMDFLEPSTSDLIRAQMLKEFTKTWFGYKISIEACIRDNKDPYDFYRLMIDQLLQRRADFENVQNKSENLAMLFSFYLTIKVLKRALPQDQNLLTDQDFLFRKMVAMRPRLCGVRERPIPGGQKIKIGYDYFAKKDTPSWSQNQQQYKKQVTQALATYLRSL